MRKWIWILLSLLVLSAGVHCLGPEHYYEVRFIDSACIKPHHEYQYQTCEPLILEIDGIPVTVPEGTDTDLASVPRWLWTFVAPAHSALIAPSIVHDYLYSCPMYTRKQADEIFYSALYDNGVGGYSSWMIYAAVRVFGWKYYQPDGLCIDISEKEKLELDMNGVDLSNTHRWDHLDTDGLSADERILIPWTEENEITHNT